MARKKKSSFLRMLGTLVLVCLLGYFCYMYINQGIVLQRQNEQIDRMTQENARLEEEYQKMLDEVQNKSTLEYIDKYMRSHFGMVKDGEIRVDIVEE
ncbi:MAG: septum formation initiator family protein [Clostridiales bacterium]|nr:septum formation initiator family protein [Clostridiales bacterium]